MGMQLLNIITKVRLSNGHHWYNRTVKARIFECSYRHNTSTSSSIFSTSNSENTSRTETPIKMPTSSQSKTWERSAKQVQNTNIQNQYLEKMRTVHDPNQHIKTLEDELMGAMAEALKKQSDKIYIEYHQMNELLNIYLDDSLSLKRRKDARIKFNECRNAAKHAKWELIVHRQAIGFRIKNHDTVNEMFPIPPPLPELDIDEIRTKSDNPNFESVDKEYDDNMRYSEREESSNLYERFIHAFRF